MQPLDADDPRNTYEKIAASIRAAILSGELAPGEHLDSQRDLAVFFGVNRATVGRAISQLQREGYLESGRGSNAQVRETATLPVAQDHPLSGAVAYLFELGTLKNLPRAGWLRLGVRVPESVAEHSFRVGVAGMVLAAIEGADVGRTSALCLLHDSPETRIGDVTAIGRAYLTAAEPEAVAAHQTAAMPEAAAKVFTDLVAEYEAGETPEAKVAKDADKIESLLQAVEYSAQGYDASAWIDTSVTALRTEGARQLAQAIISADPHHWWKAFADSYHELRGASKARRP